MADAPALRTGNNTGRYPGWYSVQVEMLKGKDRLKAEKAAFERGEGGALVPAVCVDKALDELSTFAAFAQEAEQFSLDWVIVFAASLSGRNGTPPSAAETALHSGNGARSGMLETKTVAPFARSNTPGQTSPTLRGRRPAQRALMEAERAATKDAWPAPPVRNSRIRPTPRSRTCSCSRARSPTKRTRTQSP